MRRRLLLAALVLLGWGGAMAGAWIAPASHAVVGPLGVDVEVRPSLRPGVAVTLPPVGAVRFDTHRGPVAVRASIRSVDLEQAGRWCRAPPG